MMHTAMMTVSPQLVECATVVPTFHRQPMHPLAGGGGRLMSYAAVSLNKKLVTHATGLGIHANCVAEADTCACECARGSDASDHGDSCGDSDSAEHMEFCRETCFHLCFVVNTRHTAQNYV